LLHSSCAATELVRLAKVSNRCITSEAAGAAVAAAVAAAAAVSPLQSKSGHIYNKFSWGNLDSLWTQPRAAGIDVRQRIIDYYRCGGVMFDHV
jgi:hypothetical protein